jgi:hypothetical protein
MTSFLATMDKHSDVVGIKLKSAPAAAKTWTFKVQFMKI